MAFLGSLFFCLQKKKAGSLVQNECSRSRQAFDRSKPLLKIQGGHDLDTHLVEEEESTEL